MKTKTNILTGFLRVASIVAVCACVGATMAAHAAINNTGCDDEEANPYINPELALCTTHAYNIGSTTNPESAATRQMMKDVIALKTTVITQEMYSQYDLLRTTVKRLKTELQKQILLDQLKVASGDAGSSLASGTRGSTTGDKNNPLGDSCNNKGGSDAVIECLQNHFVIIGNSTDWGAIKRQLLSDYAAAENWNILDKDVKANVKAVCSTDLSSTKASINKCLDAFRPAVAQKKEQKQENNRSQYRSIPW